MAKKSPAREAMDEAVRLGVAPVLEAAGFRRAGDPRRVARDVGAALERFGLPWIDHACDLREARTVALQDGDRLSAAACSLVLGERDEARRIAEQVQREAPTATLFLDWARRRGLLA